MAFIQQILILPSNRCRLRFVNAKKDENLVPLSKRAVEITDLNGIATMASRLPLGKSEATVGC